MSEKKRDLRDGKSWFEIVALSNPYLWLFIISFGFFLSSIIFPDFWSYPTAEWWVVFGMSGVVSAVLGYKGLWQKYNDLKNGRVR